MAPLIKLSKLSHWPAVEINSKQGAPASEVLNILQTARDRWWGCLMWMTLKVWENRTFLSFFICMQIRLLHKLTLELRVTPHLAESGPMRCSLVALLGSAWAFPCLRGRLESQCPSLFTNDYRSGGEWNCPGCRKMHITTVVPVYSGSIEMQNATVPTSERSSHN